eukprot:gene1197-1306_t
MFEQHLLDVVRCTTTELAKLLTLTNVEIAGLADLSATLRTVVFPTPFKTFKAIFPPSPKPLIIPKHISTEILPYKLICFGIKGLGEGGNIALNGLKGVGEDDCPKSC